MTGKLLRTDKLKRRFLVTVNLSVLLLIAAWIIIQCLIFYRFGLVTDFEAKKYIYEANTFLKTGSVDSANYWLYFVQIFLIAAAIKLQTGFFSVVLVQLFFNIWATYSFYKLLLQLSNNQTSIILTLFLILNYPLQTFNTSLQTESLFYSFTILFSCFLLNLKTLSVRNFIKVLFLLFLISFTRPTGFLFVPCTFLYLFFRFFQSFSLGIKIFITTVISIIFLFLLNSALGSGGELDFMLPFRDERVICGVPTIPHFVNIRTSDNPNSVFGLFYYITHNTGQFFRLALLRSKAFFGLTRSYYSFWHNFYLCIYFFPLYIVALMSVRKWISQNRFLFLFCISVIAVNWITVILTCDDWHNRFFLTIAPYIYLLSIPVLQRLTIKMEIDGYKRNHQP
jgi:hypothetical protein